MQKYKLYDYLYILKAGAELEEVLRSFSAVKVPIQQRTNTPLQVKVLHEKKYYELDVVKVLQ